MKSAQQLSPVSSANADECQDQIYSLLLADDPDCTQVRALLERDSQLSPVDARRVLYEAVTRINAAVFPPITKLELIHTEGCNLACAYCFEKEMLGYRCMPCDIGRKAIDLLLDYSGTRPTVSITHFGGEPTVNFRGVREITQYAEREAKLRGKTATFSMTSNGLLIDEAKATFLAEHHIMVLLSIDGLKQSHDRCRVDKHGQGTFDRAMQGLRALKKTQQWVGVKMTVMPENTASLFNDVLGLYELGVNQFVVGYATGIKWSDADMHVYVEQWGNLYRWYQEKTRDDLRIMDFEDFDQTSNEPVFSCQAGNDSITVAVNGEISPCSKILGLDNKRLLAKLGDVEYGLTHLRNRLNLVGSAKLISGCNEQEIAQSYRGGCWATNYSDNRDMFQPSMQDYTFKLLQRSACAGCSASK